VGLSANATASTGGQTGKDGANQSGRAVRGGADEGLTELREEALPIRIGPSEHFGGDSHSLEIVHASKVLQNALYCGRDAERRHKPSGNGVHQHCGLGVHEQGVPRWIDVGQRVVANVCVSVQVLWVSWVGDDRIGLHPAPQGRVVVPGPIVQQVGAVVKSLAGEIVLGLLGAVLPGPERRREAAQYSLSRQTPP